MEYSLSTQKWIIALIYMIANWAVSFGFGFLLCWYIMKRNKKNENK